MTFFEPDPRFLIDTWSPLSHKGPLLHGAAGVPGGWLAPAWTGPHGRRLAAYKILAAYMSNVSRMFLADVDEMQRPNRREYGDPATLVEALRGALMGDEQTIEVEGADDEPDDGDDDDVTPGADDDEGADPTNTPRASTDQARIDAAKERQEWLNDWAQAEHMIRKVNETEGKVISLGDGVYVLRWSGRKERPLLRVYDPGFYFPVMSEDDEDEFPTTVHLAWEFQRRTPDARIKTFLRRITYHLDAIGAPPDAPQGAYGNASPIIASEKLVTWIEPSPEGATNADGRVLRTVPYQDEPVDVTCYLSDGTWEISNIGATRIPDLDEAKAEWAVNDEGVEIKDLDLMIDFLPVIHVPNTSAEEEHYGRSALMGVAQLFDDIQASDTDLAAAAGTTGTPPIVVHGATVNDQVYGPGKVFNVSVGGGLDMVDTSKSLDALLKYKDALIERLSTNARVPGAVLGRIDPSKIASGVLLALSFGPLNSVVNEMRLVRSEKYPLLLKFVQRLAIVGGTLDPGPALKAELEFGSFLPSDKSAMVTMVRALIGNGTEPALVSRQQALGMLIEVGFDIDEAADELERIQGEDYAGAIRLLDATGSEKEVYEYLGLDYSPEQAAAALARKQFSLPGAPPDPNAPPPPPAPGNLNAPPRNAPPNQPPPNTPPAAPPAPPAR